MPPQATNGSTAAAFAQSETTSAADVRGAAAKAVAAAAAE
jgi:hypothetical protein